MINDEHVGEHERAVVGNLAKVSARTEMRVSQYKPLAKGDSLRGFFDVILPSGMVIHGATLHERGDARWIGLPGRQYEKDDGTKSWARVIDFADRPTYERFQRAALAALDQYFAQIEAAHA